MIKKSRKFTIVIIIVILITIILSLYLISRYSSLSRSSNPFTYGDTVTIQSMATSNYLIPSCAFSYSGINTINGPISAISTSTSQTSTEEEKRWEIIRPPADTPSNNGYVFRNISTRQYMFFPYICTETDFTNSNIFAVSSNSFASVVENINCAQGRRTTNIFENIENGDIKPSVLYKDSRFVFQIRKPSKLSLNSGQNNIFLLLHSDAAGLQSIVYTGGNVSVGDNPTAPCSYSAPCTSRNGSCVRYAPYPVTQSGNFQRPEVTEQTIFRITRV